MKRPFVISGAILGFIVALALSAFLQTYGTRLLFAHVVAPRIAEHIAQASAEQIDPALEGRLVHVHGALCAEGEGAPLRLGAYTLRVEGVEDGWLPTTVDTPVEVVGRQRGSFLVPTGEDAAALMEMQTRLSAAPAGAAVWAQLIASLALSVALVACAWVCAFGYVWRRCVAKSKLPPMKRSVLILSGLCFSLLLTAYSVISTCATYHRHGAHALQEAYGIRLEDAGSLLSPDFFDFCQRVRTGSASYSWIILIALFLFSCVHSCIRRRRAKKNG